jgi:hypothetical protein
VIIINKVLSVINKVLEFFFIMKGISSKSSPPILASILGAIVGFVIGVFLTLLGIIAFRKDLAISKKPPCAREGSFSPRHTIGEEGIYEENNLSLRGSKIADILVIQEYQEIHLHSGRLTIYTKRTVRVKTKNG